MPTRPCNLVASPSATENSREIHRLKRQYDCHLRRAKGLNEKTVEHCLNAIDKFARFLGETPLKKFCPNIAMDYVDYAIDFQNPRSGKKRQVTTVVAELNRLKIFLIWLHSQPGYKSRIRHHDIEYLSVNRKDLRAAKGQKQKSCPSVPECLRVFQRMPRETEVEMRDRALFALLMLTGARIDAAVTLQVRHINLDGGYILQCGAESRTKGSKTFLAGYFNIDKIYRKELRAWIKYLIKEKHFSDTSPLFPKPQRPNDIKPGRWTGLTQDFYKGPGQPSRMVSDAFFASIGTRSGPHSVRRTLTKWAAELCRNEAEFKAASLNLGHSDVRTTKDSYLHLSDDDQIRLVRCIGKKRRQ